MYRTFTLGESETPGIADTAIATAGQQTVSYDFHDVANIVQRIDRYNAVGDYWTFYRPDLDPIDATIVVRGGSDGYACYTKGNTHLFSPPNASAGYLDRQLFST